MGIKKEDLTKLKDGAINAIKNFFKFLRDFAFRNSVAEKLEEIEAQLQNGIENDLYTQEQLKQLTNTMNSLAGQLRNMSPEAMKETAEKAVQEIESMIDEMYNNGRVLSDRDESDFFTAMKNLSGHDDMTDEQFREFFEQNAKLYDNGGMKLEKGQVEGKTTMLIEIGKECYQATFDVSEPKPSKDDPNKKERDYVLTVDKFNGSYYGAKEITSKTDITKHETMLRKFILPRNLRRREDIERLDLSKLVKTSTAIRDVQTIRKFSDKVNESQDGKYEFFYEKESNTFRARDKETGKALVAVMKKGDLFLIPAESIESIKQINAANLLNDQSVFKYEAGKGIIDFDITRMDDATQGLFRTPEFMQFLETKGIPTEELRYYLETSDNPEKKPRGYSKVSRDGLQNVDDMYRALYQVCSSDASAFDTRAIHDNRKFAKGGFDGAVYLSVSDKAGNTMSFSFEKDGTPRDINYRPKGGKFHLAQNLNLRGNYGVNYETLRYDEAFAKLFDTFKTAYNLYESRVQHKQMDAPVQQQSQVDKVVTEAQKASEVTDISNESVEVRSELLLKFTLQHLQTTGMTVEALTDNEKIGVSATKSEQEAVKAILLDYEIDKDDVDKLVAGKGLKSKRMLDNMKDDLVKSLEALEKNASEQETDKADVDAPDDNHKSDADDVTME